MTGVCSRPRYEFQLMNALILPLWQRTTSQTASPNRDCPVVALSDRKTVRVSSSGFFCVETCQPPDPVTFAAVGVREWRRLLAVASYQGRPFGSPSWVGQRRLGCLGSPG